MHKLRQHIIHQLAAAESCRHSDLKPTGVESNLFSYHLGQLTNQGLVNKRSDGFYALTVQGQAAAKELGPVEPITPATSTKIVALYLLKDSQGRWLLTYGYSQPLKGLVGLPAFVIEPADSIKAAAGQVLLDRTGLSLNLTHRGDGYISIRQDQQTINRILFHLFGGNLDDRPASLDSAIWGDPRQMPIGELMPYMPDLIKLVAAQNHFFLERAYTT
jgi:hypothetical protein